jgi:hypothetical protein
MHELDCEFYSYCSDSSGNNSNCDHTTFTKAVTATDEHLIGNHIPFLVLKNIHFSDDSPVNRSLSKHIH